MDILTRQVSHLVHSNWICRFFCTRRISGYPNKLTFASFQGKSHDKELVLDEKQRLANLNKVIQEEERLEEKNKEEEY